MGVEGASRESYHPRTRSLGNRTASLVLPQPWKWNRPKFSGHRKLPLFLPPKPFLDPLCRLVQGEDEAFSSPLLYPMGKKKEMKGNMYGIPPISQALRKVYISRKVSQIFAILLRRELMLRGVAQDHGANQLLCQDSNPVVSSKAMLSPGKALWF